MELLPIITLIAAVATLVADLLRQTAPRHDRIDKGFSDALRSSALDLPVIIKNYRSMNFFPPDCDLT